jgi:phosphatidylglycerol---prolipoprotein diacylglyceryl transferase
MHPILARDGPFFIYSYTVVMGLGIAASLGLTVWLNRRSGRETAFWLDGLLVAAVVAIGGGRVGYVWSSWSYFQQHPAEIGLVWQGGLSYHGALLAGLLALWVWSRRQHRPFAALSGLLAPALCLLSSFGWLACWLEGCAYGRETVLGFLAGDLPDSFGVFAVRYQTQWLGFVWSLLLFSIILLLWHRFHPAPGRLFWLALLGLSLGRLLITFLRGDPVLMMGQFRLDTLLDGGLVLLSLAALAIGLNRERPARISG